MKEEILLFGLFFMVLYASAASAGDYDKKVDKYFDDRTNYDIYFDSGDDSVSVVENVRVERFEEIAGKTFIVVQAYGLKFKESEGYILFDSITAILPDKNFRVKNVSPYQVKRTLPVYK